MGRWVGRQTDIDRLIDRYGVLQELKVESACHDVRLVGRIKWTTDGAK